MWGPDHAMKDKDQVHQDHEVQRAAWATGWFLGLLKARRLHDGQEQQRTETGLAALGIRVAFEEDASADPLRGEEVPRG